MSLGFWRRQSTRQVKSDGNVEQHAADGYAITHHAFRQPAECAVSVQRSRIDGGTATTLLHVQLARTQQTHDQTKTNLGVSAY